MSSFNHRLVLILLLLLLRRLPLLLLLLLLILLLLLLLLLLQRAHAHARISMHHQMVIGAPRWSTIYSYRRCARARTRACITKLASSSPPTSFSFSPPLTLPSLIFLSSFLAPLLLFVSLFDFTPPPFPPVPPQVVLSRLCRVLVVTHLFAPRDRVCSVRVVLAVLGTAPPPTAAAVSYGAAARACRDATAARSAPAVPQTS